MKKKLLITIGSILLIFTIAIIVIPSIFKDEIKDEILRYVNKNSDLKIAIEDYDLSLISNFPQFTFELEGVNVVDADENELLTIDLLATEVDAKDLIVDKSITINSISVIRPVINYTLSNDSIENNVVEQKHQIKTETTVDVNGILKESESESESDVSKKKLSLNISNYEIVGASIKIKDENNDDFVVITNLNHNGFGVLQGDNLELNTFTFIDDIDIYDGKTALLKNAQIKGDFNLGLDLKNNIYSLKDNSLSINNIRINWVGVIKEIDESYDIDLRFDTPDTKFKDLLSMITDDYNKGFEDVETKGQFKIEGDIQGLYNDETMPSFKMQTSINDAYVKYPDLPESIDDINLILNIDKPQGINFDEISVSVPKASIRIADNKIDASMTAYNLVSDPHLQAKILADFDLSKLRNAIPIGDDGNIDGEIFADVFIKGKMSDLEEERYDKFDAKGDIKLSNFRFKTNSLKHAMIISDANIHVTPKEIQLKKFDFKLGKSDIKAKGNISKYLEYAMKDKVLLGNLDVTSNYFYAEDFMLLDEETSKDVVNNVDSKKTQSTSKNISDKTPPSHSDTNVGSEMEVVEIPRNINFDNKISINHFRYGSIKADNVNGNLGIKNENAYLKNVRMNTLDGSVLISGNYDSKNKKSPKTDFNLELKNIDIQELSSTFNFVKQIAPIVGNTSGKLSSKLSLRTSLDQQMNPIYKTMYSKGNVKTKNVSIENTDFIKKFGDILNVEELKKDPKVSDVNISFTISKGVLLISPFDLNIADIKSNFSGSTNIGEETLDMDASIVFPRKYLGKETNAIIDNAVNLANTFGANVKMGNTINVNSKIKGDIKSPKYSLTYGPGKAETPEKYLKQEADKIIEKAKKEQGKELEKKANDLLKGLFK